MPPGPLAGAGNKQGSSRVPSLRHAIPIEDAKEFHSGVGAEIRLLDGSYHFGHAIAGDEVDWAPVP